MIVIDSSAIVAIWKKEPGYEVVEARLAAEPLTERFISAATFLEAGAVLAGTMPNAPMEAVRRFERWIVDYAIEIAALNEAQARIALLARIRFGRGFGHPAKLNFGDCFSYALAKTLKAPLLYVGDDFDKTDVKSAWRKKRKKA
jgi:ribonuclease VapC